MGRYVLRCLRLVLLIPALLLLMALATLCFGVLAAGVNAVLDFMPYTQPGGPYKTKDAQAKTAISQMQSFQQAIQAYATDNGAPPTTKQGLDALVAEPASWPKPRKWKKYLADMNTVPKDPWGNDYNYRSPGPEHEPYEIVSYGADGKPGGKGLDADIVVRRGSPPKEPH